MIFSLENSSLKIKIELYLLPILCLVLLYVVFDDKKIVENENNQWMIRVESKWFIYDTIGYYTGLQDVLNNYLNDESFDNFSPRFRDYPDINIKDVEDEWLSVLNKI